MNIRCFLVALPIVALSVMPSLAQAQTAPPRAKPNTELPSDLSAIAALDAPISIDGARLPVADVLGQIEKQSGVRLALPADLKTKSLVVVFQERPLREVMSALGSLYGLDWFAQGEKSYVARQAASPLERDVLHLGHISEIRARRFTQAQSSSSLPAHLLAAGLDATQLASKEGVALTSLSSALRDELQNAKRINAALDLLQPLALKSKYQLAGGQVHVLLSRNAKDTAPHFMLLNRDGEFVTDLGAMQAAPPATGATP